MAPERPLLQVYPNATLTLHMRTVDACVRTRAMLNASRTRQLTMACTVPLVSRRPRATRGWREPLAQRGGQTGSPGTARSTEHARINRRDRPRMRCLRVPQSRQPRVSGTMPREPGRPRAACQRRGHQTETDTRKRTLGRRERRSTACNHQRDHPRVHCARAPRTRHPHTNGTMPSVL